MFSHTAANTHYPDTSIHTIISEGIQRLGPVYCFDSTVVARIKSLRISFIVDVHTYYETNLIDERYGLQIIQIIYCD